MDDAESLRMCMLSDLRDATESTRVWKLKCVQAEAELRALKNPIGQTQEGSGQDKSPTSLCEESADEVEKVNVLSDVLALERHIAEMNVWHEVLEQKVQAADSQAQAYEERYAVECRRAESSKLQATLQRLVPAIQLLENDVQAAVQKKEALLMQKEEFANKRSEYTSKRSESLQEAASLRSAAQSRHSQLGRLQGELVRNRAKSERKLRQVAVQLSQCQSELKDAVARSEVADERLRKVRQFQSKMLRGVREETKDLQAEVQQHLESAEQSQAEIRTLHNEETELLEYPHEEKQRHLEDQVKELRSEVDRAVEEVASKEAHFVSLRAHLQDMRDEQSVALANTLRLSEESAALSLHREVVSETTRKLEQELREQQEACEQQYGELERLREREAETESLEMRSAALTEEFCRLEEATRQRAMSKKNLADELREATRRCSALKVHHGELQEAVSSSTFGREAAHSILEQVTILVVRKVESLLSCLGDTGGLAKKHEKLQTRSQTQAKALLQSRLQVEHAESLEALLLQERKRLVQEQQKFLDGARFRGPELQKERSRRRDLDSQLAQRRQALAMSRSKTDAQIKSLVAWKHHDESSSC